MIEIPASWVCMFGLGLMELLIYVLMMAILYGVGTCVLELFGVFERLGIDIDEEPGRTIHRRLLWVILIGTLIGTILKWVGVRVVVFT